MWKTTCDRAGFAAALTGHRSAAVLDTLAAAYAEAGAFEQAVATARSAIELATAAGDREAEAMQRRLPLSEKGQPYRDVGQAVGASGKR